MKVRKLEKVENIKTRKLWERIFDEDTPEFLAYYYSMKTEDNEIYAVEDGGKIRAMLHLNPYRLQIGDKTADCHYIVAVATDENYRKRGFMAALLKTAVKDMHEMGEPFTFLMPAAEAIYRPHGFRFIYNQNWKMVKGKNKRNQMWDIKKAEKADCAGMAEFANGLLKERYDIYARRDTHYYQRLLEEFGSEHGGMILVKENGTLVGMLGYACPAECEIMEPLFQKGYEEAFLYAVYKVAGDENKSVKCMAYGSEAKPMIMAKILDIPKMFECMEASEWMSLSLTVTDEPGGESLGRYLIEGRKKLTAKEMHAQLRAASIEDVEDNEEPAGVISIGTLTGIVFGYLDIEELALAEYVKKELKKLKPLKKVFLNEVV